MAVTAYVGRPRSGKSYGVTEFVILPACLKGRTIYTNLPVYEDVILQDYPLADIHKVDNKWFESDANLMTIPGGALIVIDEAWRVFPAGQALNRVSKERSSFFAEHGHRVGDNGYSQEIVLVVQDLSKIAKWARADIDKTYVATKLDAAGMDNKFRVDIYQGGRTGPNYPAPDLGFSIQEYKPSVYKYYLSHTLGNGQAGIEITTDRRATVFSHPMVKYGIPLGLVAIVFLGWSVVNFFTSHKKTVQPPAAPASVQESSQPPKPPVKPAKEAAPEPAKADSAPPPLSSEWRITGSYTTPDGMTLLLESPRGRRKLPVSACKFSEYEWQCLLGGKLVTNYSGPEKKHAHTIQELNPIPIAKN